MKTILALAQHPELAEQISAALNSEEYRVIQRTNFEEAEPLLLHGVAHICAMDMDMFGVQGIWIVEKLRRRMPKLPIFVFTSATPWEMEEEAYLKGVTQVLQKPVRGRMLNTLLARLDDESIPSRSTLPAQAPETPATTTDNSGRNNSRYSQPLDVLRDFSSILTHSLNAEGMLKQFLLFTREMLGINRAAIFLRSPQTAFDGATDDDNRRLRVACAIGLSAGLLEHFELSLDSGIGGQLSRMGRILRRNGEETRADVETHKEFELLGAQVAVPILNQETLIGVAVFDDRVTGEPLVNAELELIFHLLEQVGLGVRNIWLHDQLAANHEMMADVLRELSSACVVVSRDLTILHANKTARKLFGRSGGMRSGDMDFADLPQQIGGKVYQVLKTGTAIETFRYEPEDARRAAIFNITIVPFQRQGVALPNAALLVVEDLTQAEQLQKLEVEATNLRLIKTMADRLAHEIGNALVPLSTHQQLLDERFKDPEFRTSLNTAMADGVKRVSRLINQMRFLARDTLVSSESFPLAPLIEEAYEEAQKYQPVKSARLKCADGGKPIIVNGDRAALKHALAEIMLNALQANLADPQISVRLQDTGGHATRGKHDVLIEIQDNGGGFTAEMAQRVPAPFFTTRNVGLGLGLTVSQKIIETHNGKLEIVAPQPGQASVVRISLPVADFSASSPAAVESPSRQQKMAKQP